MGAQTTRASSPVLQLPSLVEQAAKQQKHGRGAAPDSYSDCADRYGAAVAVDERGARRCSGTLRCAADVPRLEGPLVRPPSPRAHPPMQDAAAFCAAPSTDGLRRLLSSDAATSAASSCRAVLFAAARGCAAHKARSPEEEERKAAQAHDVAAAPACRCCAREYTGARHAHGSGRLYAAAVPLLTTAEAGRGHEEAASLAQADDAVAAVERSRGEAPGGNPRSAAARADGVPTRDRGSAAGRRF
jgi:hypothetical protein